MATGCYVQTENQEVDDCIDIVIGNNKKKDIVEILETVRRGREKEATDLIDIGHTKEYENLHLSRTGEHTKSVYQSTGRM